jgi:hypothetical protein
VGEECSNSPLLSTPLYVTKAKVGFRKKNVKNEKKCQVIGKILVTEIVGSENLFSFHLDKSKFISVPLLKFLFTLPSLHLKTHFGNMKTKLLDAYTNSEIKLICDLNVVLKVS